ncbi:MAG: efflux RND transporter permease subunit [Parvibaculales bacterium]
MIERFILYAISRSRAVLTILACILIGGIISMYTIPKQSDPDIPIPFVYVNVVYPGISPDDAERLITKPLEVELQQIEGLVEIYGFSAQNYGAVLIEFEVNHNIDSALADVRALVDQAKKEFPEEAEEPLVKEINATAYPALFVALYGDISERELIRNSKKLSDEIQKLNTVLETSILGYREELLEVIVDPVRMESYQITHDDLYNVIRANNRVIPAGEIDTGLGRYTISVPGLFQSREDIRNIPVKVNGNAVVSLGDIAQVRRTYVDKKTITRFNGQPATIIQVSRRMNGNLLQMIEDVKQTSLSFSQDWPEEIKLEFSFDRSSVATMMVNNMRDSITNAIILVMLLVIAALGYRSSILVGIAIPSSFIATILIFNMMGYALNIVLMFGLILAVGLLVDGAIVVVEYADRKMAEGVDRKKAYAMSSSRMFLPVLSSTATTLVAFLPLLFWPGVSGEFMKYFPITLIIVLIASLFAALLFLPVLGGLFGQTEVKNTQAMSSLAVGSGADLESMDSFTGRYIRFLKTSFKYPGRWTLSCLGLLVGIFFLYGAVGQGTRYFPEIPVDEGVVMVRARGNISLQDAEALTSKVEQIVMSVEGIESTVTQINPNLGYASNSGDDRVPVDVVGQIYFSLNDYKVRDLNSFELLDLLREKTKGFPGIIVEIGETEQGPPVGKDVQLQMRSPDYAALEDAVRRSRAFFEAQTNVLTDIEDNLPLPGIEWIIDVDREKAGRFGTNVSAVGGMVQMITNGTKLGTYRPFDADEEMDIRIRYPDEMRDIENMDSLRIMTPRGQIPISNFIERKATQRKVKIDRLDGERQITLKANTLVDPNTGQKIAAEKAVDLVENWVVQQDFADKIEYRFRGSDEESEAAAEFLGGAMVTALSMMFIILLMQFNSFYFATLTLSMAVLSSFGVLVGLIIMQREFIVIMTGLGIIALAGIVVNNAIVLIDTYQRLRSHYPTAEEAVLKASAQRLRPILITTGTTVFGMLPLAIGVSINVLTRTIEFGSPISFWWKDTALAISFGLTFSTVIALAILPLMIILPEKLAPKWQAFKAEVRQRAGSPGE